MIVWYPWILLVFFLCEDKMLWLILLGVLCWALYKFFIKPLFFWKERGIPGEMPVPFIGLPYRVLMRKTSFYDNIIDSYDAFPNLRYNGIFQFAQPSLLIRDLELIKQIGVKDFDYFTDHRDIGNSDADPLFFKNLFQLNGQEWKDMRAMLSPAFTGSKMKSMFTLISDCSQQMIDYFLNNEDQVLDVEMKDLFTRYTNDVIATCAFGLKCDSLKERENSFYMMGKDATTFTGIRTLKFLLLNLYPTLVKAMRVSLFPKYINDFFLNVIKETISYRQEKGIIRPDMIHLLLEARKGKLRHEDHAEEETEKGFSIIEESSIGKQHFHATEISDLDIAAQAFIFFFAGFDTSSTILSFMATELAVNTDVQEKLFLEICDVMEKSDGKLTYDDVTQMKYMDMVVSETLRKWPAAPITDRKCTKPYTIKATTPDEKDFTLEVNDNVSVPILGLHRNPNYYPDPDRFDPERFSDENKHKILPFTYLPFGIGPRACIGSRFALLEIKVLFAHILWKFELVPVAKTTVPIKLSKSELRIQPENGFWLGLKKRV